LDDEGKDALFEPSDTCESDKALAASTGFEELFRQANTGGLLPEDIDAFWDKAIKAGEMDRLKGDTLSYKQARQSGLRLDDDGQGE
jgi:hypothetical protein